MTSARVDGLAPWVEQALVCPADHLELRGGSTELVCVAGHTYPVVDGVPIMLVEEARPAFAPWASRFEQMEEAGAAADPATGGTVDPFVQRAIAATNGQMYRPLIERLTRYPIPELRLPEGNGRRFLDIGCNWGRWCISAARKGYAVVGVDPSLDAVRAARRVARQLGLANTYVVAEATRQPFAAGPFDVAFSYSVLQHIEKADVARCLREVARTLRPSGTCLVQLPNIFGVRSLHNRLKRALRPRSPLEVHYYTPWELTRLFGELVGPAALSVDGYFSLNAQATDLDLLPGRYRMLVRTSEALRRVGRHVPALRYAADSLYVTARRRSA